MNTSSRSPAQGSVAMATAVRQGSETVYYLDAGQLKAQKSVGGCGGGATCVPVQVGTPGRSSKAVYRMVPSSPIQAERVYQPAAGTTFAGGLQCDGCPPLCRQKKASVPDDRRYVAEPQVIRLVPKGNNFYIEDVKPPSQLQQQKSSTKSARQKLPNVMQIVDDRDWYDDVEVEEPSESEAGPETCRECLEEFMRRRRTPDVESPVYVTKAPKSKRSYSRRLASSPSPQRASSRGPLPATSSPRCATCTDCQPSYATVRSVSKPNTARSRSRKWYE